MSNLGAAGGRAAGCSSAVSDTRTAPGVRAESPRPSTGAQTRLSHTHTQPLVTAPVLSMSCPKTGVWRTGGSRDPKRSQARSQRWVGVKASLHPCLLTLFSFLETLLLPFDSAQIKGNFFPGTALHVFHGAPSALRSFLSPRHCM